MNYYDLVLPVPLNKTFSYQSEEELQKGQRVLVSFGKRKSVAFVLNRLKEKPQIPTLKNIEKILDPKALLSESMIEWLQWGARYYHESLGEIFQSALPSSFFKNLSYEKLEAKKVRLPKTKVKWDETIPEKLSLSQEKIIEEISQSDKNYHLIHGITGSGKTEIYIRLIQKTIKEKKQALFLVPEIGLTPQMTARLQKRFGKQIDFYHSELTPNQKLITWMKIYKGECQVLLGTRSALFAPFQNLGCLIIDEEHDDSYKQEERFRYHARDFALVRAKIENCICVMGSATPSLESYYNCLKNKYQLHELKERPGPANIPQVKLIEMSLEKSQSGLPLTLSRHLLQEIEVNLKNKEQSLILLNRRGFARSLFCKNCETSSTCPNCSVNLIYHKKDNHLLCHYCDYLIPVPKICPQCESSRLAMIGIGTESLENEIKTYFPKIRLARLDRDSTQKKGSFHQILSDLKNQKLDLVIGTQMIAKGHHLPEVTLVGVLGIDQGLGLPDFRASEKTFQLLMQVAGRSGRAEKMGRVLIQSYNPKHYSIQSALEQSYESFFKREIKEREELHYPPHSRLVQIISSSSSEKRLHDFIKRLEKKIESFINIKEVQVLGPSPAPLEKVRGRFRWQIILKSQELKSLHQAIKNYKHLINEIKMNGIKTSIDVDPVTML